MFDRSFNGSSFDAHDGPVRCCRAVPRSNDCQTVAAHEASGGKSTERVQLQLHARAWTKTQFGCIGMRGCGRKRKGVDENSWQSRQLHLHFQRLTVWIV